MEACNLLPVFVGFHGLHFLPLCPCCFVRVTVFQIYRGG